MQHLGKRIVLKRLNRIIFSVVQEFSIRKLFDWLEWGFEYTQEVDSTASEYYLEIINSTIIWTHRPKTSFKSVMIHEFLHLCGEVETPTRKIVDGVIRHTMVGREAIEPLICT
jgi:hypothetical protein